MPDYETIRQDLKTGDIVLFSGSSTFSSIIKLMSGGTWSHVGMVLLIEQLNDAVLIWESTTLTDVMDVEFGRPIKGVQLVPFSQRLANYNGNVAVRRLNKPITREMMRDLADLRRQLSRRPYETREFELLRSVYDGYSGENRVEDLSSLFCSELVAEAYQVMGLIPSEPDGPTANEYTPMDFAAVRNLKLLNDYELGEEIMVEEGSLAIGGAAK